jgi:shikimate kinase
VDTDVLIRRLRSTLQDIVDRAIALRKVEEQVLLGLTVHNHVISTGGSAVCRRWRTSSPTALPSFWIIDITRCRRGG